MRLLTVKEKEAGQRLDKLLGKYMELAPKSFFYKMLRKKNITLNGKKAEGSERLEAGDEIRLFLSEETIENFRKKQEFAEMLKKGVRGQESSGTGPDVIYEDEHILLLNKPAGVLSQKAKPEDVSMVEQVTAYLLKSGQITQEDLATFRPGVCNRLDRNTSGLMAAGKSLAGLQAMNRILKERSLHKYYRCIVGGRIEWPRRAEGWLQKDERANQVRVYKEERANTLPICTEYLPLQGLTIEGRHYTYLEVNLITGRSHQIRAHLAGLGHPLIGDAKYGDAVTNARFRKAYGLKHQLLHAYRMEFPGELTGVLEGLSGRTFLAPLPELFKTIIK